MRTANALDSDCVIYTRVSKDATLAGEAVERQEHDCRKLAERLGLRVTAVYLENDTGASSLSKKPRPHYEQMLKDVRAGKVRIVLAYSSSRLTRRPREWLELIDLAKPPGQGGVGLQIRTVASGDHDLTTADGQAVALTIAVWDAAEANRIGERSRAAHEARARKGEALQSGLRPFGWQEDRVNLNEPEARLIRAAVEHVTNGGTIAAVAKDWNERGVLTVRGNAWVHSSVSKVISNPRIAGIRTLHGEVQLDATGQPVRGQWEAIVTPEEHETLIEVWRSRRTVRRDKIRHFLGGKVVCGRCRGRMHGSFAKARTSYICQEGHLGVTARRLELYVLRQILVRMVLIYQHKAHHPEQPPGGGRWERQDELDSLTSNIEAMMRDYFESPQTRKPLLVQVDKLRAEADALSKAKALWRQDQKRAVPLEPLSEAGMGIRELFINTVWSGSLADSPYTSLVDDYIEEVMIRPTQRGRRNVVERALIAWTPAATPWGAADPPPLPRGDAEWLADYERLVQQEAYKPRREGSQSPHLPRVLEVLRSDPTISVKGMAADLGVSDRMANRVMVYAKGELARDAAFKPSTSPRDLARQRFVRLAELMRSDPAITGHAVCEELGVSSGYASKLMTSVRNALKADPDHDFGMNPPTTLDDRRGNKRLPTVRAYLQEDPDLKPRELAERLGVGETYAQQLLKAARTAMQEDAQ